MKEVFTFVLFGLWVLITFLPLMGWELVGDPVGPSIAYAAVTVSLAYLLKD